MSADAVTYLDPYIFGLGFFACAAAIMLSQVHRDEGVLLPFHKGIPFNLMRKMLAIALLVAAILGFWIVGPWWLLLGLVAAVAASVPVAVFRNSKHRLSAIFALAFVGITAVTWAQSPTLVAWGVLPS